MKIDRIRINGIKNPVGFDYDVPVCSFRISDTDSKYPENIKIIVSKDEKFENICYQKEGKDLKQNGEALLFELQPRTIYYISIEASGDKGDSASGEICTFETGKMNEQWNAEWIAAKKEDKFHPVIKRNFEIKNGLKQARVYMSGVGAFEPYINGVKIGSEYLTPYMGDYSEGIQVFTYSLTEHLKNNNSFEILLGKGWYMGRFGLELQREIYGNRMAAIAEIFLEYEDGTTEHICSDEHWTYYGSDIEDSGIYDGEIYNRKLWEDKDNSEKSVEIIDSSADMKNKCLRIDNLFDRISLPVLAKEEIAVKEVITTPAGETVLDFGQNFAGYIEFYSTLEDGLRVEFDFGEVLQDKNFYNGNYRDAKSQFVYVSNGKNEWIRPHFTYFGFRYVRITGWKGELIKENFVGKVVYSDVDRTGNFDCGMEKINKLYENTMWGLKSNFMDMPTDCPQRSERLGWTGDAQIFAPTASYHVDTRAFFHKYLKDLRKEQIILNGGVPNFVPNTAHKDNVSSVWGDAATFIPEILYRYYGNVEEMRSVYPLMKDWVDYISDKDIKRGGPTYLFDFGFTFGDWLALDGATPTSFKGSTDDIYIASVYYYQSVKIVEKIAGIIGKNKESEDYKKLAEKILEAVRKEYFTETGRLAVDTQTAYVIALKFGVYTDKEKIIEQFKVRLKKDCYEIKGGLVGAPMLCTVLAESGMTETAYDFILRESFPGWLYQVNLGATTVWERWNSLLEDGSISDTGMNSMNHYVYGSVSEFLYAYVGGIRPKEAGFKKAVIEPRPDIRLGYVNVSYDSVSGKYVCQWKILEDGRIQMHVEIPFGCEAEVVLPGSNIETFMVNAGSYDYLYMPESDYRKIFNESTLVRKIKLNEKAMAILGKYTPILAGIFAHGDKEMDSNSLMDILHMDFLPFEKEKLLQAIEEIKMVSF